MFMTEFYVKPTGTSEMVPGHVADKLSLLTFKRLELNLLPYPFKTNCRDYVMENLRSQVDCIYHCVLNNQTNNTPIPTWIPYDKVDDVQFEKWTYVREPKYYKNIDHCESRCQQVGCHLVRYTSRRVSLMPYNRNTIISIQLPNEPELLVNYRPKMTFIEYLPLACSVMGLWLGISVFSFYDMSLMVRNVIIKKQQK